MAKCNQLTLLPIKGLMNDNQVGVVICLPWCPSWCTLCLNSYGHGHASSSMCDQLIYVKTSSAHALRSVSLTDKRL